MSKNVAVFVDVANIFYAAKAAGVDIDYVTLLKSATAGRDFVRAYAYTGLDPENENQRQFHAFLGRSGYKVVSKDIRKYGDGRIKANLDIELVVDFMRMAEHLDIAVVVSGDGDFAPAIRAVQQMGVRVEVISFRGNTSSDLIEVADVFTDIGSIARVEKGARSGRRVAAEGDMSMTEVPEKETEGPVRRRRGGGRRVAGPEAVAVAPPEALPGNVIVLPGERISRVEPGYDEPMDAAAERSPAEPAQAGPVSADAIAEADGSEEADGPRRRRRRGGRGRGRGRRPEGVEAETMPAAENGAGDLAEDEEFLDESPVALPQHSTFGSVWDSQLGVPSAPLAAAATDFPEDEEDYEDEPEIPEYLIAERRNQASRQRGGGRGRDRGGAYRAFVDRERYGRGGAPSYGGGGNRAPERPRGGRDARPQGPAPARSRPPFRDQRPPQQAGPVARPTQPTARPTPSAEPWSEVPPEVAELLKAEFARRSSRQNGVDAPSGGAETPAEAPALPARRRPSRAASAAAPSGADEQGTTPRPASPDDVLPEAAAKAAPKRTTRARKSTATTGGEDQPAEVPKRRTTRRAAPPDASPEGAAPADAGAPEDTVVATEAKPRRRATTRKAKPSAESAASDADPVAEAGAGDD